MQISPVWSSFEKSISYPGLENDISVDVAVIGAGITGITTALLLQEQGLTVGIFEARSIGKGTTGQSTGNIYLTVDELLHTLSTKYNSEKTSVILNARRDAFDLISKNVQDYQLDCDYQKSHMYIFEDEHTDHVKKEMEIARESHIKAEHLSQNNFHFKMKSGMKYPDQAQINPLLYVQALAKIIEGKNCKIYENTRILSIAEEDGSCILHTSTARVKAKFAIQATHTPIGIAIHHAMLGPYREYGVAATLKNQAYPEGIFWEYTKNEKFSFRSYSRNDEKFVICIGKPHKVGQAEDNSYHLSALVHFLKDRFPTAQVTYSWGGQNYKPSDFLPFIGRKNKNSNVFVACGFSTDGLIYGTLSAKIISQAIIANTELYQNIFKASRIRPIKSAKKITKENLNVAGQLLKDYVLKQGKEYIGGIKPGTGSIIRVKGKRLAVFKEHSGEVKIVSAVCTHLGCIVHWNNVENSWDCPCHGSRFEISGEIIEGPATAPLQELDDTSLSEQINKKDENSK